MFYKCDVTKLFSGGKSAHLFDTTNNSAMKQIWKVIKLNNGVIEKIKSLEKITYKLFTLTLT